MEKCMLNNLSSVVRNLSSVFLLVLALIVGVVGAQATGLINTKSGGYLVCVNSTTKVVTHPGTSSCPNGSKKLVLGAQGAAGTNGKDGKTLWNGVKDPESTLGAPGDMFINSVTKTLFGPKNLDGTWPAGVSMVGPKGDQGLTGATGAAGAAGAGGSKITELSICGAGGTSLCKIGAIGPGGGLIFFVDYNDQYAGFNYLEAAPSSCGTLHTWSSDTTNSLDAVTGWAARAVGSGQANTTAMLANSGSYVGDTSGAAFYANALANGVPGGCVTSKDDWFLGSLGEMKLMYDNLQGLGGFVEDYYWSSSQTGAGVAWIQNFSDGRQRDFSKFFATYVRPVRAF